MLSAVFLLPRQLGYQPVGVIPELPDAVGEWWGQDIGVTQHEVDVLGTETTFSRKRYENGRGDQLVGTIVLSGQDMMQNIHRPERCLEAQGWAVKAAAPRNLKAGTFGPLETTRLHISKRIPINGQTVTVEGVCYYFFVGYTRETGSHFERMLIDSIDRVTKGYDQRWGMVMVYSEITKPFVRFGRDEVQTDEFLQHYIERMAPKIIKESVRGG
jgi:EpsI family protein